MKSIRHLLYYAGLFVLLSLTSASAFAITINDAVKVASNATPTLNVRQQASTSATIIASMTPGQVGTVVDGPITATGYTWYKVQWDAGALGWSVQDYLPLNTPTPKTFTNGSGVQLTTGNTNVRSGPSTSYSVLASYGPGITGTVINSTSQYFNGYIWWQVSWAGGLQGWSVQDWMVAYTPPSTVTSVSASCSPTSVAVSQTSQCSATVSGTNNPSQSVSWSVVSGSGSINSSGVYTASSAAGTATVRATSVADTSKYGNATITAAPPASTVTGVSASCSPTSIAVSQTSQCSWTVNGTGNYSNAVNWSVVSGSGSVNGSGLYTAPASVPNPATATVRATSVQDSSKFGNTSVTTTAAQPTWGQSPPNVFLDSTSSGWYIELWPNTTHNSVSPSAYSGDYGIEFTTSSQWGRAQFTTWAWYRFNTAGYTSVSFWVNIGSSQSEDLHLGLLNSNYGVIQYKPLIDYVENHVLSSYQWKLVTIPLIDLGGGNTFIYGFEIQSENPATFSIDNLTFNTGVCP